MKALGMVLVIMFSIALEGCVETIVMDPDEKDLPIMVNCILNPDFSVQTLYLQYVKGEGEKECIPIEEAKVYLTASIIANFDTLFFHYVDGKKWETSYDPHCKVSSGKYDLFVEVPGKDPIRAETTIPEKYDVIHCLSYGSDYLTMKFGYGDYCSGQIKTGPVWIVATKGKHYKAESFDNHYSYIATDHPFADDFNINEKRVSDLLIELEHTPFTLYYSWLAFENMQRLMSELPLHDNFVRIDHLDKNFYHIIAGPLESSTCALQDHYDFVFVSEELDEYLRSIYIKSGELDHDLTKLYSTENAYSNIEGGVGIFGSYVCQNDFLFCE